MTIGVISPISEILVTRRVLFIKSLVLIIELFLLTIELHERTTGTPLSAKGVGVLPDVLKADSGSAALFGTFDCDEELGFKVFAFGPVSRAILVHIL